MTSHSGVRSDLVARLRAEEPLGMLSGCCDTVRLVNSDGPEAADRIEALKREVEARDAEILRLVDALVFAHETGFEWPSDPLPFGSIAHNLFIERGNDPERIEARAALSSHPTPEGRG